ncbi:MAG: hypothetical protein GF334_04760 [Candidatus Altiarchaeales archaeon]|nr:hypothetical protein [Candidatus Altiarchaeales archaeon]
MPQKEAPGDLDLQEGTNMSQQDPVVLNIEVSVETNGDIATVRCPEELRITERVASVLNQAMIARGLKLKHWVLTDQQKEDLVGLSNVVVGQITED